MPRYMRDVRNTLPSECYCEECGSKFPLPRTKQQQRSKGHLKTLYCIVCKKSTRHLEVRSCDVAEYHSLQH